MTKVEVLGDELITAVEIVLGNDYSGRRPWAAGHVV